MRHLYKTTIVIWSEYEPGPEDMLEDLAFQATEGDAYCSKRDTVLIEDPAEDKDWDGTEFFGSEGGTYGDPDEEESSGS